MEAKKLRLHNEVVLQHPKNNVLKQDLEEGKLKRENENERKDYIGSTNEKATSRSHPNIIPKFLDCTSFTFSNTKMKHNSL